MAWVPTYLLSLLPTHRGNCHCYVCTRAIVTAAYVTQATVTAAFVPIQLSLQSRFVDNFHYYLRTHEIISVAYLPEQFLLLPTYSDNCHW